MTLTVVICVAICDWSDASKLLHEMLTMPLKREPSALYNTSWIRVSGGAAYAKQLTAKALIRMRENGIKEPPAASNIFAARIEPARENARDRTQKPGFIGS